MKNIKIFYFIAAIIANLAAFVSCGGNDDPQPEALTLSGETLQLTAGTTGTVNILTGNGDYKATSNAPTVAVASAVDKTITVAAIAEGTAKITVTDAKNQSKTITVTVLQPLETGLFNFLVNGEVVPDGSEVTEYDTEGYGGNIMLVHSPIRIQKIGGVEVEAMLRISVDESSNIDAGYCGWGFDECKPVPKGTSLESSITVQNDDIIDPAIETNNGRVTPQTYLKVKYELIYAGRTQTLYWIVENIR
ncbi:MAG: Ig-like domain-containing protein [Prevotellaceae bacterium]|jgi:hypothetical protein|nr:Ig-like domain-containing protein [Prevotellaceae bacterium]